MNAWNLSQRLQLQTHACVTQKFKKQIKQEFKKKQSKNKSKKSKIEFSPKSKLKNQNQKN
jgi:hypothetical protein